MTQFDKRNLSMMMDFYEMTMANGYFVNGGDNRVAFDVFYRRSPDSGGFAVFAGLEQVVEFIENFHFAAEDVSYLRSLGIFKEDFLLLTAGEKGVKSLNLVIILIVILSF